MSMKHDIKNTAVTSTTSFRLFAKNNKIMLRELILSSIKLTANSQSDHENCVSIARCRKRGDSYEEEKARIDFGVNKHMNTFHLHDIFISPDFGLLVEAKNGCSFQFEEDGEFSSDLLLTDTDNGRAYKPSSYMRSETIE